MSLSKKQVKFLKALAHDLRPVVQVGKSQVTEGVLGEIKDTLLAHELIKIKVAVDSRAELLPIVDHICENSDGQLVQIIGKTVVLFRPATEKEQAKRKKPAISLPRS